MIQIMGKNTLVKNKNAKNKRVQSKKAALCSTLFAAVATMAVMVPEQAEASFIYTFGGEVTNPAATSLNVGDAFSGSFEFTIDNPDQVPEDPGFSQPVLNLISGSFTVGTDTVMLTSVQPTIVDDGSSDIILINFGIASFSSIGGASLGSGGPVFFLNDLSASALSSDNLLDALASSASFPLDTGLSLFLISARGGNITGQFDPTAFSLTDTRVSPVPLPAAAWLFLSGLGGLGALKLKRQKTVA